MLAADGVEEDVLDAGEGRNEEPWTIGRWAVEGRGVKVQDGGSGVGQPDQVSFLGGQLGINESRLVPTSRRQRGGPASA